MKNLQLALGLLILFAGIAVSVACRAAYDPASLTEITP